jgi:hypothetical protein
MFLPRSRSLFSDECGLLVEQVPGLTVPVIVRQTTSIQFVAAGLTWKSISVGFFGKNDPEHPGH